MTKKHPSDLTEASFLEAIKVIKEQPLIQKPSPLIMSVAHLEQARALAHSDPEFAKQVLDEFGIDLLAS